MFKGRIKNLIHANSNTNRQRKDIKDDYTYNSLI